MGIVSVIDSIEHRLMSWQGYVDGRAEELRARRRFAYEMGKEAGRQSIRDESFSGTDQDTAARRAAQAKVPFEPIVTVSSSDTVGMIADDADFLVTCPSCGYVGSDDEFSNSFEVADLAAHYAAGEGDMSSDAVAWRFLFTGTLVCPECLTVLNPSERRPFSSLLTVDPEEEEAEEEAVVQVDEAEAATEAVEASADLSEDEDEDMPFIDPTIDDIDVRVSSYVSGSQKLWQFQVWHDGVCRGEDWGYPYEDDAESAGRAEAEAYLSVLLADLREVTWN